ncbi:hypothetical protein ACTA71_009154 [Dictyostelium dimigraforme]
MESETPENISEIIRKELRIERCSSSIRTKIKNIKNSAKTNSASENLSENVNPATLAPATVNPATLTPATVNPATPTPATINPATLTPATVNPATINPATINPATINPATLTPAIINPATLAPATINPATLAPATVNPTTFANSTAIDMNSQRIHICFISLGSFSQRERNTGLDTPLLEIQTMNDVDFKRYYTILLKSTSLIV